MKKLAFKKNRHKSTGGKILVVAAVLIFMMFSAGCFFMIQKDYAAGIVLAVNSGACNCTKNKCVNMEKLVRDFISEKNLGDKVRITVVDLQKGEDAQKVMDKYQMGLIPYMVIINKEETVVYRAGISDVNWDTVLESLKKILDESGGAK